MSEEKDLSAILDSSRNKMAKSLSVFESELTKIRTGRASASLVDHIRVDYYGALTPLNQLATIAVPEIRTILVQPWDVGALPAIEKAIMQSDLGINPSNDGKVIRLSIPVLTEERRKELVKHVGKLAEEYRISVRQIRKETNNDIKEAEKDKKIPEDEAKRSLTKIQELTDDFIDRINKAFEKKENEIMQF